MSEKEDQADVESSEDADEWLFSSIKKYDNLHMFDLQHSATEMQLGASNRVCIACTHDGSSEILELCLPDRLLTDSGKECLSNDRDFNFVSGGFHAQPVHRIRHVPDSRQIVTSEFGENSIRLWQLGADKSDVHEEIAYITNSNEETLSAEVSVQRGESGVSVAFGSSVSSVCVADTNTAQVTYSTQDLKSTSCVSGLEFEDNVCLLACEQSEGHLWQFDTREPVTDRGKLDNPQGGKTPVSWNMAVSSEGSSSNSPCVVRLSSEGVLVCSDIRNLSKSVACLHTGLSSPEPDASFNISFSPVEPHLVAISGFDGNVYIYNTQDGSKAEPVFTHEGHSVLNETKQAVRSLCHVWHPTRPHLLLSSASDASLHAWSYLRT